MTRIEDETKARIAAFLPEVLEKSLQSYADFAAAVVPTEEAKDFAAYHGACKTAVAHIELLVKLARQVDLDAAARAAEDCRADIAADIAAAIAAAEAEAADGK